MNLDEMVAAGAAAIANDQCEAEEDYHRVDARTVLTAAGVPELLGRLAEAEERFATDEAAI